MNTAQILNLARESNSPTSGLHHLTMDQPLPLDAGGVLSPVQIAYKTWGRLNADKTNAILLCHALTGDQYAIGPNPVTGRAGWWETLVGPGQSIDTDRFFVICSNVLGSCFGTSGPASINPATGQVYGLDFPMVTIGDMVRLQVRLIDHLGIDQLYCVAGGSMGGMQVLEWAASHPRRLQSALAMATGSRHSAQNIALHEVGRRAVMLDPDWMSGGYATTGRRPVKGLALARMLAHVTYLSEAALHRKFDRNLRNAGGVNLGLDPEFQVESYLHHQGTTFAERFDANAYLYLTKAMDHFDLAAGHGGSLPDAFDGANMRCGLISFTSDWLFPREGMQAVADALGSAGARVSFFEIETDRGHDAFLLEGADLSAVVREFLGDVPIPKDHSFVNASQSKS